MFYEEIKPRNLAEKLVEIGTGVPTLKTLLTFMVDLNVVKAKTLTLHKETAVVIFFDVTTREEQTIFRDFVKSFITGADEDYFEGSKKVSASFPLSVEDEGGTFEISFIVIKE